MTAAYIDNAKRFVALTVEKRQIEARLKEIEAELRSLQEPLLDYMADSGIDRISLDGYTLYPLTQTWASALDGDQPRACAALEVAGLSKMVQPRFNAQTLSAWVREQMAAGQELPVSFEGTIKVLTIVEIRARKAEKGGGKIELE